MTCLNFLELQIPKWKISWVYLTFYLSCVGWLIGKPTNIKAITLTSKKTLNLFSTFPLPPPQPFEPPTAQCPCGWASCPGSLSFQTTLSGLLIKRPTCLITWGAYEISRSHRLRPPHAVNGSVPWSLVISSWMQKKSWRLKWWHLWVKLYFSRWITVLDAWLM